ncbi:MAG: HAMP domain-containing histidine kinase [Bacteroidales bacterium]|nr:HAMP domain-containing histidine kinase [Bacteroidales bacterium]
MNLYRRKLYTKLALITLAAIIITISLWYSNTLVSKIGKSERRNIETWASAIHQRAQLVETTSQFFQQLQIEERNKVELLAEATKRSVSSSLNEELSFYHEIIANNTTIPVILTDYKSNIIVSTNIKIDTAKYKTLTGDLRKEFNRYSPIAFDYLQGSINAPRTERTYYYYYKDSRLFEEMKQYVDTLVNNFMEEVLVNSVSVPVIFTDSTHSRIESSGNINIDLSDSIAVQRLMNSITTINPPIILDLGESGKKYIYYEESSLLKQLRYYPYIQFAVIGVFLFLAYLMFNSARRGEQNRVWVGMAKETAHQLGTPLSSLLAWVEMLRIQGVDDDTVDEIEKDVLRLTTVTDRFSKIGSMALLKDEDLTELLYKSVSYLRTRTSKKVEYTIHYPEDKMLRAPINVSLFEWVIENLCKNAVDAMSGAGKIDIYIKEEANQILIDFTDTGKGVPRAQFKAIFKPGYTNKKRGWGLGLSLSDRIIREYHKGKLFVKDSVIDKGTTFRIVLPK